MNNNTNKTKTFSQNVRDEISMQINYARHCGLAELAAILSFGGEIISSNMSRYIRFQTESITIARKCFTLIEKTFNINVEISIRTQHKTKVNTIYTLLIVDQAQVIKILQGLKLNYKNLIQGEIGKVNQLLVQKTCCKRAFIRGAFLVSGSMSNPKKSYHLELVSNNKEKAEQLRELIETFSIDPKIVARKNNYVVYIKEGSQIVDFLNVVEAHVALVDLVNVRILKDMRNTINRQVNCEAANINKTVIASKKQIEDIVYIRDHVGFGDLSKGLKDIAILRVEHPDASLKELGTMLSPQIGKSGVNHRLRKLSMIADHYREHKEEK